MKAQKYVKKETETGRKRKLKRKIKIGTKEIKENKKEKRLENKRMRDGGEKRKEEFHCLVIKWCPLFEYRTPGSGLWSDF